MSIGEVDLIIILNFLPITLTRKLKEHNLINKISNCNLENATINIMNKYYVKL